MSPKSAKRFWGDDMLKQKGSGGCAWAKVCIVESNLSNAIYRLDF
jgi:hypothetical protein